MSYDYLDEQVSEMAKQLPKHRLELAKGEFSKMDFNKDGKIELQEFLAYSLAKEVKRLMSKFKMFDTDKDGAVDFEEFLLVTDPNYALFKSFADFDVEGNGRLSLDQAVQVLERFVIPLERSTLEAHLKKENRTDNPSFSYEEFLGILIHNGMQ